jgi:sterol desaturase/sphingolipid hydroxylase (fatty acid hydroxylase superfamily)
VLVASMGPGGSAGLELSNMIESVVAYALSKVSAENLATSGLLLATVFGSALFVYIRTCEKKSLRDFVAFLAPPEILFHPSARADLLFWLTRKLVMPLLIPAGIIFVATSGYLTNRTFAYLLGIDQPLLGAPGPITVCVFTVTMLLAYDLSYYLYHVGQHKIPLLWELHKVHHSAEVLVGITKDRVHPLDELMNRIWDGVIPGICFGLWTVIALNPVEVTIFGINVYVMRNLLMMDFVRHTHIGMSFGMLNHVVLCPHWHQVHHSTDPRHFDKNFGLGFSFWDRFFGTLHVPDENERFKYGLTESDAREYQSLFGLYILPLKKMAGLIAGYFYSRRAVPNR